MKGGDIKMETSYMYPYRKELANLLIDTETGRIRNTHIRERLEQILAKKWNVNIILDNRVLASQLDQWGLKRAHKTDNYTHFFLTQEDKERIREEILDV